MSAEGDAPEAGAPGSVPTPECPESVRLETEAIDSLACAFLWELERVDPSGHYEMTDGPHKNWEALDDAERTMWCVAMERFLKVEGLFRLVLDAYRK